MKKGVFDICENICIAKTTYKMTLSGDTSAITAPGQFVNIELDGFFLRRPISVCDWDTESLTIIYKTVGGGTQYMSRLAAGDRLDLLTGLGNGYDITKSGMLPVLIGGGAGVPPMYALARRLISAGVQPTAILGFNSADEIFFADEFSDLGAKTIVTTADGSVGIKGFVTDALSGLEYSYVYTCGPEPMLRAVYGSSGTSGQFSFEERMGCGFGACMGCTCETKYGAKRICRDGPVLEKEEIIW